MSDIVITPGPTGRARLVDAEPDLNLDLDLDLTTDEDDDEPLPFGRDWAFDFISGQFVRHGRSPVPVHDFDSLRVWVEKALRTARGAHTIYSDGFGIDDATLGIGNPYSPENVGRLTQAIEDALLAHDRIVSVEEMRFTGGPASEALFVSFLVVVDDEEVVDFSALPLREFGDF